MTNRDLFDNNSTQQLELSYELLLLLQWMVQHEPHSIKKLINRAVREGLLTSHSKHTNWSDLDSSFNVHNSIVDFLSMLESMIHEAVNEDAVKKVMQRNLIPVIDQIDAQACDNATVQYSLEKATTKMDHHPEQNPREILLKELLRRWKPAKKNVLN